MPNSLSLMVAFEALQLVLIAALVAQWRFGRRDRQLLVRRCAGADERTGALVHELNQPLTAILSNAQAAQRFLASEHLDPQELREILDDIVTDDKRAAGIVRRIGDILHEAAHLGPPGGPAGGGKRGPGENSSVGGKQAQ